MSASTVTSYVTFGTLGGSFLHKLTRSYDNERLQTIRNLEVAILGVATAQYGIGFMLKDPKRIQRWRYLDWLITTPMLLRTLFLLAEEKGYKGSFNLAFGADLVMVTAGYLAEFSIIKAKTPEEQKKYDTLLYVLGFAAFGIVLLEVNKWIEFLKEKEVDIQYLEAFFYAGWTLYGLNFITPNTEIRQTGFNILDLFNKAVYSSQLDSIISKNFID